MKERSAIATGACLALFLGAIRFAAAPVLARGEGGMHEGSSGMGSSEAKGQRHVTITGEVNEQGLFQTVDGQTYRLEGKKAKELKDNPGERYQISGTLKEKDGKMSFSVNQYRRGSTIDQPKRGGSPDPYGERGSSPNPYGGSGSAPDPSEGGGSGGGY